MVKSLGVEWVDILCIGNAGYATYNKKELFLEPAQYETLKQIFCSYDTKKEDCSLFRMAMLSINYDGKVYPCPIYRDLNFRVLGDIYHSNISKIVSDYQYNCSNFRKLKEGPFACIQCNWFEKCRGKCRGRAEKAYGNINCPDPFACFIFGENKDTNEHNPNDLYWGIISQTDEASSEVKQNVNST